MDRLLVQDALDHVLQRRDEISIAPDFLARCPANQPEDDKEDEKEFDRSIADGLDDGGL